MERTVNADGYAVYTLTSVNANRASGFFGKSVTMSSTRIGSNYWPGPDRGSARAYTSAGFDRQAYVLYYAAIMFDPDELAELRKKTVREIKLAAVSTLHQKVVVDRKMTGGVTDFRRCNKGGTETDETSFGSWDSSSAKYVGTESGRQVFDLTTETGGSAAGVPRYGYVFGHIDTNGASSYSVSFNSGERADTTAKRALLTVTTDEKQATLSFDANGGTGAPAAMTGWGSEGTVTWTNRTRYP